MDHMVTRRTMSVVAMALLLAAVGIFGLMFQTVARRTHEIGVRMALGAHHGDVVGMVLRQGLVLAAIGVTIGVAGALAVSLDLREPDSAPWHIWCSPARWSSFRSSNERRAVRFVVA